MHKKILVTGFPHTGTSILKSKFGECGNLYECPYEWFTITNDDINNSNNKEFILKKTPIIPVEIRANGLAYTRVSGTEYSDYILIFVIRNPYNVMSSLIKSGHNPLNKLGPNEGIDYHHSVGEYLAAAKFFKEAKDGNYKNVYSIRYEDFFPNDFEKLKELMDKIGVEYTNDVFLNRSKDYKIVSGINLDKIDTNEINQKNKAIYRTWQINQPFQNMNGEVNIPDELSDILKNSNIIQELGYSDPRVTG